GMKPIEKL
ncbi:arginine--tRNA ligase, putative, partial [Plasmodium reichenowi]